jgi:hypothetical protein
MPLTLLGQSNGHRTAASAREHLWIANDGIIDQSRGRRIIR